MNIRPEQQQLYEMASLGKNVHAFLTSNVGEYILSHIDREIDDALQLLRVVDATDSREVLKAQNAVWRAESLKEWVVNAVKAGLEAEGILEERDE